MDDETATEKLTAALRMHQPVQHWVGYQWRGGGCSCGVMAEDFRQHLAESALLPVVREIAAETVQLCPKCGGQGLVSRPPHIPVDQPTWVSHTTTPHRCDLCDGRKVIRPAVLFARADDLTGRTT